MIPKVRHIVQWMRLLDELLGIYFLNKNEKAESTYNMVVAIRVRHVKILMFVFQRRQLFGLRLVFILLVLFIVLSDKRLLRWI